MIAENLRANVETVSWAALSWAAFLVCSIWPGSAIATDNPNPPQGTPVKLIFIHHSTGGNWLGDPVQGDDFAGGLGQALMDNNYFVSATNYGWTVSGDDVGSSTDIGHWWNWFRGPNRDQTMTALFNENGQNFGEFPPWTRMQDDPGGENEVILFKSCFPNSHISGNPNDPPTTGSNPMRGRENDLDSGASLYTVANAKGIYNDILEYFSTRTDKLWILITPPPITADDMYYGSQHTAAHAANARALNDWLVNDWLAGYPHDNVAVFDFFNVLTSNGGGAEGGVWNNDVGSASGNHHRWNGSQIEHVQNYDNDFSAYGAWLDSHPTDAGGEKATAEFVPLLNIFYNRFKGGGAGAPRAAFDFSPANPQPGQTVSFTDQSTGGPTSWLWNFGDGTPTSSSRNPTHVFASAGTYAVSLRVSNNDGENTTSKQVTVSAEPSAYQYLIAGVAHAPGQAGTSWRTDIAAVNLSGAGTYLTFTFYSATSKSSVTRHLAAGETDRWEDVLVSTFGLSPAASNSGSIKISSDQSVVITARTYNETDDGTFGQFMPACTSADALSYGQLGVLSNLEKSTASRTNIGILNLGNTGCTATVRLFNSAGSQVGGALQRTVAGQGWSQLNDVFVQPQEVAYATIEVATPGGKIWAYASLVDMSSGDPTTIPVVLLQE